MIPMRLAGAAAALVAAALGFGPAAGRELCDPQLVARTADTSAERARLSYAPRGDRCEGLYAQDVAGGGVLTVISFTANFEEFDPGSMARLVLSWPTVGGSEVEIRAQSQRPKLYYRMDTVRLPPATTYAWQTDVLQALGLRRADIGVVAWTRAQVGHHARVVYVPLRVGAVREAPLTPTYTIVLVPETELEAVYLSVVAVDQNSGRPRRIVRERHELGHGVYYPRRGFTARVAAPADPGLYRVDVVAVQPTGTSTTTDLLFLQPARS